MKGGKGKFYGEMKNFKEKMKKVAEKFGGMK